MARKFGEAFVEITADSRPLRRGLVEAVTNVEASVSRIGSTFANIQRFAAMYLSAGVFKDLIQGAYDYQLQLTRLSTVLRTSFGADIAAESMRFLREEADRLGYAVPQIAEQFQQLAASTKGTGVVFQTVKELFGSVAEAGRALGLSQEQLSRAFTALSQVASKGKITMEEIRGQLAEAIPGAVGMAAKAMGVHISQLEQAAKEYTDINKFLRNLANVIRDEYGAAVAQSVDNIDAALARLRNAWQAVISGVLASEDDWRALARIINDVASALLGFAGSMERAGQAGRTFLGEIISAFYQIRSYVVNIASYFDKLGDLIKAKFGETAAYALKIFTNIGDPAELQARSENVERLAEDLLRLNEAGSAAREALARHGYELDRNEERLKGLADAQARSRTIQDQLTSAHALATKELEKQGKAAGKLKEESNQLDEITKDYVLTLGQLEDKWQAARQSAEWGMDAGIFLPMGSREQLAQYQQMLEQARQEFARAGDAARQEELQKQQHFLERIHDLTADAIYSIFDGGTRSFGDFLNRLKDMFLRFLAEIIAKAAAQPIVLPIVASLAGLVPGVSFGSTGAGAVGSSMRGLSFGTPWESIGYSLYGYGDLADKIGEYLVNNAQFLGRLSSGFASAFSAYFGIQNLLKGGLGGYVGGGMQVAGSAMAATAALMPSMAALGPIGAVTALAGSVVGGLLGGQSPDDADLFFALGYSTAYKELSTALDKAVSGAVTVNIRKGDYLSDQQAAELERTLADYFANWFESLGITLTDSIAIHINDLQDILKSGGVQGVIDAVMAKLFESLGDIIKTAVVDQIETEYADAVVVMREDVLEAFRGAISGAGSWAELNRATVEYTERLREITEILNEINSVFEALSGGSAIIAAINAKYDNMTKTLQNLGVSVDKTNLELARQVELQRAYAAIMAESYRALVGLVGLTAEQQWNYTQSYLSYKYGVDVTPELVQATIDALANATDEYISELNTWLDSIGVSFAEFVADLNAAANALTALNEAAGEVVETVENTTNETQETIDAVVKSMQNKYGEDITEDMLINMAWWLFSGGGGRDSGWQSFNSMYEALFGDNVYPIATPGVDTDEYSMFVYDVLKAFFTMYPWMDFEQLKTPYNEEYIEELEAFYNSMELWIENIDEATRAFTDIVYQLEQIERAYTSFMHQMMFSSVAPVQSLEAYQTEYARLYAAASENPEYYDDFLNFALQYLEAYNIVAGDAASYQALYDQIMADAAALKTDIEEDIVAQGLEEIAGLLGTESPLYQVLSDIYEAIQSGQDISVYFNLDNVDFGPPTAPTLPYVEPGKYIEPYRPHILPGTRNFGYRDKNYIRPVLP